MGVRGLQTFVRENRGSLCRSVLLPERDPQGSQRGSIPLIVDAWGWVCCYLFSDRLLTVTSVIFKLYLDSLPWASGGEYLRFYQITKQLIIAWRKVGLEPTFVFDGKLCNCCELRGILHQLTQFHRCCPHWETSDHSQTDDRISFHP